MIQSRRAIPSRPTPVYAISLILLLCIFLVLGWLWQQAKKNIDENGPVLIPQRVANLLGTSVSLSKASLSFPNHLLIEDFRVYETQNKILIIKSPRVEIDLSLLSLLTATIRPKNVRVISPNISTPTITKTSLGEIFPIPIPPSTRKTSQDATSWIQRLKPVSWPININPNHIEIIAAQAHIENEEDGLPSIDGRFNLTATRFPNSEKLDLQSATINLEDAHIFYHGIQGVLSGTLKIDASDASAHLSLALPDNEKITLEAKIFDYKAQAKISFELNTHSYDLKNFAMIKYPLAQLTPTTNVTGLLTSSSPFLYGAPFQSFSASVLFNHGNWRVDAVSLNLLDEKGELIGSIVPESAKERRLAHMNLSYVGASLPDFQLHANLLSSLGPILLQGPYSANTEITIETSSYPLQATEIKTTSTHGDLFLKGIVDLFSGYTDMTGSFLKPAPINKDSKDTKGIEAISLSISGPLNAPILSEPPNALK